MGDLRRRPCMNLEHGTSIRDGLRKAGDAPTLQKQKTPDLVSGGIRGYGVSAP